MYGIANMFGDSQYLFPNGGTLMTGNSSTMDYASMKAATSPMSAGTPPAATRASTSMSDGGISMAQMGQIQGVGLYTAAVGAISSAVGAYYAAESQKIQLKMQAQNAKFSTQMAAINARGAEFSAISATRSGYQQYGRMTMQQGQVKAATKVALNSRGIQGGVGSAREVLASVELIQTLDRLTMSSNIVRQAEAYRTQRQNYLTQSSMDSLTSQNLRKSADTISSGLATSTSLMGGASEISMSWLRSKRFEELLGGVSQRRI